MTKPIFAPVDPVTYLFPEPTMAALREYIAARVSGATPEEIATAVNEYLAAHPVEGVTEEVLASAMANHEESATPHPVYDDMPSLTLIFNNGLV